jgi:hypothetical protein
VCSSSRTATEGQRKQGFVIPNFAFPADFDRHAPRKPRLEGRGRGELYKNVRFLYREAPPGRAGRLHNAAKEKDRSVKRLKRFISKLTLARGPERKVFQQPANVKSDAFTNDRLASAGLVLQ